LLTWLKFYITKISDVKTSAEQLSAETVKVTTVYPIIMEHSISSRSTIVNIILLTWLKFYITKISDVKTSAEQLSAETVKVTTVYPNGTFNLI
jgi:energy-converting hydrogenase Eha subunit C